MKTFITTLCALSLMASAAHAIPQDAAIDERNNFVVDKRGNCVRTKWMETNIDECNPPAPEPVAKPAPAPAPEPVVKRELLNIYFDFNSSTLNSEGQHKLSQLSRLINLSRKISDVHIIGFADEIGSSEYNMKLSQKRAKTVESYLDANTKIGASVAEIRGAGELENESCDGKKRKERIECLSQDRKVEIKLLYEVLQ